MKKALLDCRVISFPQVVFRRITPAVCVFVSVFFLPKAGDLNAKLLFGCQYQQRQLNTHLCSIC